MKAMIFTTDAIFALVIVGAAISLIIYFNYVVPTPYFLASTQAQSTLSTLGTVTTASLSGANLVQCYQFSNTSVLQAAVQMYLSGDGGCATYMLDSVLPMTNYGIFINGIHAPIVAQFNGAGSYVHMNNPFQGSPSAGTISVWAIFSTYGTNGNIVYDVFGQGLYPRVSIQSGQLYLEYNINGVYHALAYASIATACPLNTWCHIVATVNALSGATLYVNGVAVASDANTGTFYNGGTSLMNIGYDSNLNIYMQGKEANLQVYNSMLSGGQVASLYQEGLLGQPIISANTVGWWPLEGDTADYSGYNNAGTPNSLTYVSNNYISPSFQNGYGVNGAYAPDLNTAFFDGQDSYINAGTGGSLAPSKVTIAAWVNVAGLKAIQFIGGRGDTGSIGYWLGLASGNAVFSVGNGATEIQLQSPSVITTGNWYYIVGTYDGTTQTIYVNGVALGTSTSVTGPISYTGTPNTFLGQIYALTSTRYFNGLISNVQVYNTALSAAQISLLYQEGIVSPPISGAGSVAWWLLDGDTLDYSGYNNTGTAANVVYVPSNYLPSSLQNTYGISRAAILAPFSKYQNLFSSNAIFSYNGPRLYDIGVEAWR